MLGRSRGTDHDTASSSSTNTWNRCERRCWRAPAQLRDEIRQTLVKSDSEHYVQIADDGA